MGNLYNHQRSVIHTQAGIQNQEIRGLKAVGTCGNVIRREPFSKGRGIRRPDYPPEGIQYSKPSRNAWHFFLSGYYILTHGGFAQPARSGQDLANLQAMNRKRDDLLTEGADHGQGQE